MKLQAIVSVSLMSAVPLFGDPAEEATVIVTRPPAQTSRTGPAENFTGAVRIDQPFQAAPPGRAGGARVTPRARPPPVRAPAPHTARR